MKQKGYTNKEFRIQECTLISKNTYDRIIGGQESLFDKLTGRKERENKLNLEKNSILDKQKRTIALTTVLFFLGLCCFFVQTM